MSLSGFPDWNPKPVQSINVPQQNPVSVGAGSSLTTFTYQFTAQYSGLLSLTIYIVFNTSSGNSTDTINININGVNYYSKNLSSGGFLGSLTSILAVVAGDVIQISFSAYNAGTAAVNWQLNAMRIIIE